MTPMTKGIAAEAEAQGKPVRDIEAAVAGQVGRAGGSPTPPSRP
ncbi:hypothetical protein [Streptomyces sp. NPDC047061]